MSLHYLVKREMLITHVLPFSCYRKKLPNLSYLNCDLRFRQILIELLQCVGTIARVSVTKRTETSTENGVGQAGSRRHCDSHSSVASLIAPDHCCVFCTIFCNISHTRLSNGFNSGEFGGHSRGGINSGVFSLTTQC